MGNYVCSGAGLKCNMGDSSGSLTVLPDKMVNLDGQAMANIMDYKPLVNISNFGQCQSLSNPTVASATASNNGKLQPMPCIPNTVNSRGHDFDTKEFGNLFDMDFSF